MPFWPFLFQSSVCVIIVLPGSDLYKWSPWCALLALPSVVVRWRLRTWGCLLSDQPSLSLDLHCDLFRTLNNLALLEPNTNQKFDMIFVQYVYFTTRLRRDLRTRHVLSLSPLTNPISSLISDVLADVLSEHLASSIPYGDLFCLLFG